jgi:hypothetical protein
MLQCFYLDLVWHVQDLLKYNNLVLILFEKQAQLVAKVCYKFRVLIFFKCSKILQICN